MRSHSQFHRSVTTSGATVVHVEDPDGDVVVVVVDTTADRTKWAHPTTGNEVYDIPPEFKPYKGPRVKVRPRVLPPKFLIVDAPNKHRKFRRVRHRKHNKKLRPRNR